MENRTHIALAILGICLSSCTQHPQTSPGPVEKADEREPANALVPDTTLKDLGLIPYSEVVSTSFSLTNKCGERVRIESIESDCGCLKVMVSTKDVEAGETIRLTTELDTRGLIGSQYHQVEIRTQQSQTLTLYVTGDIEGGFSLDI